MIRFDQVSVVYGDAAAPAVSGVDLTVPEGELVLLVGESGSGKSTLLGTVSGLVPHFTGGTLRGRVTVGGRDTRTHRPRELADLVGTVGQDPLAHFVTDTVEDELAYGMESLGLPADVMRRRVEETLDLLGLADLRDRPIATLSGGQRQRVAIGSVLTPHPRVLVLDEPTSALDPAAAEEVLAVLQRLVHDLGTTVLLAEHRLERVVQYADQVILLPGPGQAPVAGTPTEIMAMSPVHPPVVALGRLNAWDPLPLSVRDARRRATALRDHLANREPTPGRPSAATVRAGAARAAEDAPTDAASPAGVAPAEVVPAGKAPAGPAPDGVAPAGKASAPASSFDAPTGETATGEAPRDGAPPATAPPGGVAPAEVATAGKAPVDVAPDKVAPGAEPRVAFRRARFGRLLWRRGGGAAPSARSGGPLVAVAGLTVRRGRVEALRQVSLTVGAGEAVALMGRNGAGKSTLLGTMVGMVAPSAGSVLVSGRAPHRTPPRELIREVGLVPQEPRDLLYADTVAAECAAADADAGAAPGSCRELVRELLPEVADETHPRDLSEGQRLALALAVVLTGRPRLVLLDEPTRGLDYAAKARLVGVLRALAADGHAIVLATHDVELAAELAHRVVILADGEIVADGPTAHVVVSSPAFAPQVAKVMAPSAWLTVNQVRAALREYGEAPE
ncbi:ATP-binding cassette domain-containing protein [Streptomyces sp. GMY02]|uniref:ATP-binding cassette domain-containing protein n=1 Tax=Streptomyces sp. GMY02 TaxID=1333528 RepID=UPI001C2C6E9E|nr:ATP-binding cassette domain-containing protein [Streptomyces sp. GMY02]QXE37069.1 ATP-binding cassette domain-containing protein [Streptomyces sp. GMY02]